MINGEQLIKFLKFVRMFADSTSEHADIILMHFSLRVGAHVKKNLLICRALYYRVTLPN